MKKILTILALLLSIAIPRETLAETYTLYANGTSYSLSQSGIVYSSPMLSTLASGFYIEKVENDGVTTTYYGSNGDAFPAPYKTYTPTTYSAETIEAHKIALADAPWTEAKVSIYSSGMIYIIGKISAASVTYEYYLHTAEGTDLSLTETSSNNFTRTDIDSLTTGFYIKKVGSDDSVTYYGSNGGNITSGNAYAPSTYNISTIASNPINFDNSPWTTATVTFNSSAGTLTVTGTETTSGGGDDPEPGTGDYDIYFKNTGNWSQFYLYFWGGSSFCAYIGVEMTLVDAANGIYGYNFEDGNEPTDLYFYYYDAEWNRETTNSYKYVQGHIYNPSLPTGSTGEEYVPAGPVVTYTYTLHTTSDTTPLATLTLNDGVYTATSISSLPTGFYIKKSGDDDSVTYYGSNVSNITSGTSYILAEYTSATIGSNKIGLANSPWTDASVSFNPTNNEIIVTDGSIPPVDTYTLYANGPAYNLTEDGEEYVSPTIATLESGFYIKKTASDLSVTYYGSNGDVIIRNIPYSPTIYDSSEIENHKICFNNSPFTSATVRFNPTTKRVTLTGTQSSAVTYTYYVHTAEGNELQLTNVGGNTYSLSDISSLTSGFYIKKKGSNATTIYYGLESGTLISGYQFTLTSYEDSAIDSHLITFSNSPWTSASITFDSQDILVRVTGTPTASVSYTCTLYANGMNYVLTKNGDVYTSSTIDSLASGFYISKYDGSMTTYWGEDSYGHKITSGVAYSSDSYSSSEIDYNKIKFDDSPWTSAIVSFNPTTNQITVTGESSAIYRYYAHTNDGDIELNSSGTVYVSDPLASLATGFYIKKVAPNSTVTYYGLSSGKVVSNIYYGLTQYDSSTINSHLINFANSPWTSAQITFDAERTKIMVSGTPTYPYSLYVGGTSYNLTDSNGDGVYTTSSPISALSNVSGFYIKKDDLGTITYFGKSSGDIYSGVEYSLAEGTSTLPTDLTLHNAPWDNVSVAYNPMTNKVTFRGTPVLNGTAKIHLIINGSPYSYKMTLDGTDNVFTYSLPNLAFIPQVYITYTPDGGSEVRYDSNGHNLSLGEYYYFPETASGENIQMNDKGNNLKVIFDPFDNDGTGSLFVSLYNSSYYLVGDAFPEDLRLTLNGDGDYSAYIGDMPTSSFRICQKSGSTVSAYYGPEDGTSGNSTGLTLNQDKRLAKEATTSSTDYGTMTLNNAASYTDVIATLKVNHITGQMMLVFSGKLPAGDLGYTLVGSFNGWDSLDSEAEFVRDPVDPTKYTLSLSSLSGSFQVARTSANVVDPSLDTQLHGELYTMDAEEEVRWNIANGSTVHLKKNIHRPEKVYMVYTANANKVSLPTQTIGNKMVWSNICLGNPEAGTQSYLYFRNQEGSKVTSTTMAIGSESPVAIPEYTSIPATGQDLGTVQYYSAEYEGGSWVTTIRNSNKWVVDWKQTADKCYDVVLDLDTWSVKIYAHDDSRYKSSRRAESLYSVTDEPKAPTTNTMRLLSGTLKNVTLVFDSSDLTLNIKGDATYAAVVTYTDPVTSKVITHKHYMLGHTEDDETTYSCEIGCLPADATFYIQADDKTARVSYGASAASTKLRIGDSYDGGFVANGQPFVGNNTDAAVNNALVHFRPDVSSPYLYVSSLASGISYRLVGYYGNWGVEYSYAFSKVGDTYELYVPELPLCGDPAATDEFTKPGFQIAMLEGKEVTYYGLGAGVFLNGTAMESAAGQSISLVEDGNVIRLQNMENDQWLDACTLTLTVSGGSASKRRSAAGTITLNVKSTIATTLEEVETDVETADIYTLTGICLKRNAGVEDLRDLQRGIYIYKGKKLIIK